MNLVGTWVENRGLTPTRHSKVAATASRCLSFHTLFHHVLPPSHTIHTRSLHSTPQAVGKDRFREDARKVMMVLQQLQAPGLLEADDPTIGYMMQVRLLHRT